MITYCAIQPSLNVKSTTSAIGPGIARTSCVNMNEIIGISPILKIFHSSFMDSVSTFLFMSTKNGVEITYTAPGSIRSMLD